MICLAAVATAISPEAHCRSMLIPGTVVGMPARSAAWRPMLVACEPCWRPQPITTSSTMPGSMPARFTACSRAKPARVCDCVLLNAPRKALPIGVRAVETITASRMEVL